MKSLCYCAKKIFFRNLSLNNTKSTQVKTFTFYSSVLLTVLNNNTKYCNCIKDG